MKKYFVMSVKADWNFVIYLNKGTTGFELFKPLNTGVSDYERMIMVCHSSYWLYPIMMLLGDVKMNELFFPPESSQC